MIAVTCAMERSFQRAARLVGMTAIPPILFPLTFVLALVVERIFAARELPRVRLWLVTCIAFFLLAGVLNAVLAVPLAGALAGHGLLPLARLPLFVGVAIALVTADLAIYVVHRLMHVVTPLWRAAHQLHHSAERIDAAASAYVHPLQLALVLASTTLAGGLLGVAPAASAIAGYLVFALGVFQHMNVATPRWLGYVVHRPEAHALHHARGIHAYNYGMLVLWDAVFGTRRNPREAPAQTGFWDGASRRLGGLLIGRDVASMHVEAAPYGSMNVPPVPMPSVHRSSGPRA